VVGVLHEMPAVSGLGGVRECLGRSKSVTAGAVARDHSNLRLAREPGQAEPAARQRQIGKASLIATMDPPRTGSPLHTTYGSTGHASTRSSAKRATSFAPFVFSDYDCVAAGERLDGLR
jgi:hypothetical protein